MQELGFTTEQVCQRAQQNATAFILSALAYLRERNLPVEDFVATTGRRVARSWDGLRGQGPLPVAQQAALNFASVGGVPVRVAGDERRAEATLTAWPGEGISTLFGLSQADADALHDFYKPIAEHLGLHFAWHREGEEVRLTFSR